MKKTAILLVLMSLALDLGAVAQNRPRPGGIISPVPPGPPPGAGAASQPVEGGQESDLQRFDLDFPGGPPDRFVAAISKAQGKPLNAIIPVELKNTMIMPIKVYGVTVPELFRAVETASTTERPLVTTSGGQNKSIQFRQVSMGFRPNNQGSTPSDQTVWCFYSTEPSPEFLDAIGAKPEEERVCQYFQLAPYLADHTIEDITTAIQTGWKMLKVDPMPQLSFHQETKLLIAVGSRVQVSQIPQVLDQLQRDDTSAVEKIVKWQAELADIEAKKEAGWEGKADQVKLQIQQTASEQKARNEIKSPSSSPGQRIRVRETR